MEEISRKPYDLNQFETIWPDIQEGSVKRLSQFFKAKKPRIRQKLHDNLQKSSIEPCYCSYLLDHSDGRERVETYIDLFELALKGEFGPFIEDQKSIGYIRAMEGYQLNDVFEFTMAFKDALWRTSQALQCRVTFLCHIHVIQRRESTCSLLMPPISDQPNIEPRWWLNGGMKVSIKTGE